MKQKSAEAFYYIYLFIHLLTVLHLCSHRCLGANNVHGEVRTEVIESISLFSLSESGNQTQAIRLDGRSLYMLIHFTSPPLNCLHRQNTRYILSFVCFNFALPDELLSLKTLKKMYLLLGQVITSKAEEIVLEC